MMSCSNHDSKEIIVDADFDGMGIPLMEQLNKIVKGRKLRVYCIALNKIGKLGNQEWNFSGVRDS